MAAPWVTQFHFTKMKCNNAHAGGCAMKMIAEYLEHANSFERMAGEEVKPELQVAFQKQAATYRNLAADRAKRYGLSDPTCVEKKDG